MAIRDTLLRLLGAKASIVGLSMDEIADRPLEKGFDDAALLSTYGDDAWPYIVGNKVGEQASQAPLQIGTLDADGKFTAKPSNHPVQQLFDLPNPQMDGGEFVHLLILYMGFTGHCPIEVVRGVPGQRIGAPGRAGQRNRLGMELWLHNPGPWRVVAGSGGVVQGYLYLRNGTPDVRWTPDEMTYLRWPNPNDRWYGQGHIQAARQAVMAEEYASIRDKKFEKNLGVPPGILSSEMPLGDPTAELLQKRWQQAVGGYQNAGKIAVLGSKTTYQSVMLTARDSEWLKQRLNRVEIIAGAWGMPLPLIRMQDATFSNVQDARSEFWEGTLQPRLNRIARMVTVKLLPLITTEPLVARFDYSQIEALGENDLEAAQTAGAWAQTSSVTVDEVRARLSLPPHPDKAMGARLLVSSTVAPQDIEVMAQREELGAQAQEAAIRNPQAPPAQAGKALDRPTVLGPIQSAYAADLGSFFTAQRNALFHEFGKATPEEEKFLERLIEIVGSKRFRDRLKRISQGPIEQSVTLGAADAAKTIGIEVTFSIPASEAALARVTNHLELLGKGIENTTIDDVRRIITKGLEDGISHAELRAALGQLFDDYQDWRLDRIARTETSAAFNLGAIGQYRDAGVQLVKVADGDGDEICAPWNGRVVTLDEAEGSPLGHPNAVMAGTRLEVLGAIEAGYKANWSGPLVRLTTAGGADLAIGPNHPVLTSRGWLAAKSIREGDHVIRRANERFSAVDEHLHQPVARVENIFDALSAAGTHARITAAPTYFHGDGNFCQGEVEVVRPDRPLVLDAVSPFPEQVGETMLVSTGAKAATLTSGGASMTTRETVHLASASLVRLRHSRRVVGGKATLDATLDEPLPDRAVADAEFVGDLEGRTAIPIELDEVVNVGRAEFTGHAFDLQTTSGAYFADDILVHNCTRTWIPEVGR